MTKIRIAALALLLVTAAQGGATAPAGESEEDLAKKTQNPVADLISVPFQNNITFGVGPKDAAVWVLNVQPVIPIKITEHWNLITRTIMPIVNQPSIAPGVPNAFGLGDINPTVFLSPSNASKLIWGVGPTMTLPTASVSLLGQGKWSAGPAAVGLLMDGPWVVGALANNQWSFAGWGDEDVNQFLIQPFLNYNLPHAFYLSSAPIMTADWEADSGNQWTVPVGGGAGKLVRIGPLPVNFQLQAFYNAVRPELAGEWQLRAQVQFLFPK